MHNIILDLPVIIVFIFAISWIDFRCKSVFMSEFKGMIHIIWCIEGSSLPFTFYQGNILLTFIISNILKLLLIFLDFCNSSWLEAIDTHYFSKGFVYMTSLMFKLVCLLLMINILSVHSTKFSCCLLVLIRRTQVSRHSRILSGSYCWDDEISILWDFGIMAHRELNI